MAATSSKQKISSSFDFFFRSFFDFGMINMKKILFLFALFISFGSVAHSGTQASSCTDKEIVRAYSSKELSDSARCLRFFKTKLTLGMS